MSNENNIINKIIENYSNIEESIVKQLQLAVDHPGTIGGFREEIWKSLFEQIVPKKFSIERSVFILDSNGNVSHEVDLAIFDEQYTPYIFRYGTLKFIPIEAVAVVIECKSSNSSIEKDKIKRWSDSIDNLKTSLNSIVRMVNKVLVTNEENSKKLTQTSTRPIKILCCIDYPVDVQEYFDFVISIDGSKLAIDKRKKEEGINSNNLRYWYLQLNHSGRNIEEDTNLNDDKINRKLSEYEVKDDSGNKNTILTLIFQLNQLLMLINNPILFPHMSYVNLFNNPDKISLEDNEVNAKEIGANNLEESNS